MTMNRRLERLEGTTAAEVPLTDVFLICGVAPSPGGPVNKGPMVARILTGANAGKDLWRDEGEIVENFEARYTALMQG